jgi:molecular chaperone GrpE (heat shock protein)
MDKSDKILLEFANEVCSKEQLNEGLVFFKNSKRINKYIEKLQKQNPDGQIDELVEKLKKISDDFKEAEDLYGRGKREEARALYNSLKGNNDELVKILNKETIKKSLINAGLVALALNTLLMFTTGTGLLGTIFGGGRAAAAATASTGAAGLDLAAERKILTQNSKELSSQLSQNNSRIRSIDDYEKALRNIDNERKRAERVAAEAARRLERAQGRASSLGSRL